MNQELILVSTTSNRCKVSCPKAELNILKKIQDYMNYIHIVFL
jgi:hypothetical protein